MSGKSFWCLELACLLNTAQNCTAWEDGSLGSGDLTSFGVLAYVVATTTGPADPADVASTLQEHDDFDSQDDDFDSIPILTSPNTPFLSSTSVFLYLLSPYLKLGATLLPNVDLPLKFGLPALFVFAVLSAFARQI